MSKLSSFNLSFHSIG